MYVFVGTSDYLPSADKWLLYMYCIILVTLYESDIQEETNSLAQIVCTCRHEKRITLIMNKMLVAFTFRPLAVFIHAFLHK